MSFAILGLPPFGLFYSEIGIVFAAARAGRWWVLAAFTLFLCVVFVGMVSAVLPMAFGKPPKQAAPSDPAPHGEWWRDFTMATAASLLIVTGLGLAIYQPRVITDALHQAAAMLMTPASETGAAVALAAERAP